MKKKISFLVGVLFLLFSSNNFAQTTKNKVDIKITSKDKSIYKLIPKKPKIEVLSNQSKWAEGPVILPNGDILWSDIINNRLLAWNEKNGTTEWLFPAQFHNGHVLDSEGRLLAASHGKRAIERLEKDGSWKILVDLYGDKKLNSPNDLVIDKSGEIWFTDPLFGIKKEDEGYGGNPVVGGEFVFRYNPKTNEITKLNTKEVVTPNGIALSKDQKRIYISDSQIEHTSKDINTRNIVAYDIDENKNLVNGKIIAKLDDGIPDGLTVDEKDNIWATSGHNVYIISPDGKRIGEISFPVKVANLIFHKEGNKNKLYVTGSQYLLRMDVLVGGNH